MKWGICSKANEEREFIPWSGEEEEKVKHEMLGEWENFCGIDRNEGVRRDPMCGEVRESLGETFMRQTFIVVLGKAPGPSGKSRREM